MLKHLWTVDVALEKKYIIIHMLCWFCSAPCNFKYLHSPIEQWGRPYLRAQSRMEHAEPGAGVDTGGVGPLLVSLRIALYKLMCTIPPPPPNTFILHNKESSPYTSSKNLNFPQLQNLVYFIYSVEFWEKLRVLTEQVLQCNLLEKEKISLTFCFLKLYLDIIWVDWKSVSFILKGEHLMKWTS